MTDENKTIVVNGSLLNTLLLIGVLVIVFGTFCMQVVFNWLEMRDRAKIQDLQVISMIAGTIANTDQLMNVQKDVKKIIEKKRKANNQESGK